MVVNFFQSPDRHWCDLQPASDGRYLTASQLPSARFPTACCGAAVLGQCVACRLLPMASAEAVLSLGELVRS